jgi:hypothetical protein
MTVACSLVIYGGIKQGVVVVCNIFDQMNEGGNETKGFPEGAD